MAFYPQDENTLLARIAHLARTAGPRAERSLLPLGIGDDAALYRPRPGHELILTCDWFLEGTHFLRPKHPPDSVGWKCLARAVSDIAAMGGIPRCFLMSLALPSTHTGRWLDLFLGGLCRASRRFHCALAGGDTTRRSEILINITVVGEVPIGKAILRSGAKPGDILYVSGRLGEAELGLRLLRQGKQRPSMKSPLMRKHFYPEPRLALGQWLLKKGLATAMMDLSDGLSSDLPRLCAASAVGATVEIEKLPKVLVPHRLVKKDLLPSQLALHGGDDYELLFSVPRRKAKDLPSSFQGVPLRAIGTITSGHQLLLRDKNAREMEFKSRGWDPFRREK